MKFGCATILLITIILSMPYGVFAVPANPTPFLLTQPDGTTFFARQIGDERMAYVETVDGYTIIQDDIKWWTYAQIDNQGCLRESNRRVEKVNPDVLGIQKHLVPTRLPTEGMNAQTIPAIDISLVKVSALEGPQYVSVIGTEKAVVILINFTNVAEDASHTQSYFDNLLFNTTASVNSMYNYYREVSYGNLNVTGTTGSKWYQSSKTMEYYGTDVTDTDENTDRPDPNTWYIFNLAREAVQLADADIDFSQYDTDNNGEVDHVIIVHAGAGQESSHSYTDIWSHKWTIYNYYSGTGWINDGELVDGVRVKDYTMLSESSPLGTFAHEFGHDIGLPDLYDTDYSSNGIGKWGLMSGGSWNGVPAGNSPSHPVVWCKYFLGWVNPTIVNVSSPLFNEVIDRIEDNDDAYLLPANPGDSPGNLDWTSSGTGTGEYFLVANRQQVGYDTYLPGNGILIWHIDESMKNNSLDSHRLVDLEEADGSEETTDYSGDPWKSSSFGFTNISTPNSDYYNGTQSNVCVIDISASSNNMTADLTIGIADVTPPSACGEFPANNSYTTNNTTAVAVNITDSRSGVNLSSINMTINGSIVTFTNTTITNGYRIQNITSVPYGDGTINVLVNATDNNSNILNHSWSFTVDGDAPVVTNPNATPATIESDGTDTTNLSVSATDSFSGINSVTINLSTIGGSPTAEMTNSGDTYYIITNATGAGNGTYYLPVNATDNAGNSNTSVNITLYVNDTTPPILSDNMPSNGTSNLTPTISIKATDKGAGINTSSANMTVNNIPVILVSTSSGFAFNFTNTTAAFSHGDTVNVTFNVSDNEGHTTNTSWMFYIDTAAPTITITSPAEGYSTTASSITVSGTVNGTGSPPIVTVNNVIAANTTNSTTFNGTFSKIAYLSVNANTIYANVTDAAGNTTSTLINVTRTTVSPPGGGGGGGGGGTSGEDFYNIAETETQRISIFKGDNVSYSFKNTQNPIQNIKFTAKVSAGKVASKIEVLRNTSTMVDTPPSGKVYQNINIWVGNYGWASEKNIKDMTISFTVPLDWITSNNIDEGSIALYRYNDDSWQRLPTSETTRNENSITFTSSTPGFSPFAISGETVSTPAVIPTGHDAPAAAATHSSNNASGSQTNEIEPGNKEGTIMLWVLFIFVILAVTVIIFLKKDEILQGINNMRQQSRR